MGVPLESYVPFEKEVSVFSFFGEKYSSALVIQQYISGLVDEKFCPDCIFDNVELVCTEPEVNTKRSTTVSPVDLKKTTAYNCTFCLLANIFWLSGKLNDTKKCPCRR